MEPGRINDDGVTLGQRGARPTGLDPPRPERCRGRRKADDAVRQAQPGGAVRAGPQDPALSVTAEQRNGRRSPAPPNNQGESLRSSARRAVRKHSTGATATPAPTWPLPSETWRIPVLIRGVMPVSTTLRTSTPIGVPRKP